MKRFQWAPALCLLASASACALPAHKDFSDVSKKAVTWSEASNVVSHFNTRVDAASASYDLMTLRSVEGGSLYNLDAAALFARERLGLRISATHLDGTATVLAGSFSYYPLWFVAVGEVYGDQQRVAGVFVKTSSTGSWRLSAAPRLAAATQLPRVRTSSLGAAVLASPARRSEGLVSPQTLVDRYTQVLADPAAPYVDDFAEDGFLSSIRALQGAQPDGDVDFTQTWSAEPVAYALRLADGGALVFATVLHTDSYRVRGKYALTWRGSQAAAYFRHPVRQRAALTYNHQLLLWQPIRGKPVVIGQYGGLVAATGR